MPYDPEGSRKVARSLASMMKATAVLAVEAETTPRFLEIAREMAADVRELIKQRARLLDRARSLAGEMGEAMTAAHAEALVEDAFDPESEAMDEAEDAAEGVRDSLALLRLAEADVEIVASALEVLEAALERSGL